MRGRDFSIEAIHELVEQRYVSRQKHPLADLYIYNYTPKTVYSDHWTPETRACRGLVLDGQGEVRARPFDKFFGLGDRNVGPLPSEPFEVFEKLDGSLGISYWVDGEAAIATRGSFTSRQAVEATRVLRERYGGVRLERSKTYLFEIILPWNRVVVDYGEREDLVLLAVVDTASGQELPLEELGFPVVQRYDGIADLDALLEREEERNREGYVLRFASGPRVKVKFEEYVRLHRLLTVVSARHIWEELRAGGSVEALPGWHAATDGFRGWASGIEADLRAAYADIEARCKADFRDLGDRKPTALHFVTCDHPAVLFNMLDRRPYDEVIWKQLRPPPSRPFKVEV
jgi:RNA ligase